MIIMAYRQYRRWRIIADQRLGELLAPRRQLSAGLLCRQYRYSAPQGDGDVVDQFRRRDRQAMLIRSARPFFRRKCPSAAFVPRRSRGP